MPGKKKDTSSKKPVKAKAKPKAAPKAKAARKAKSPKTTKPKKAVKSKAKPASRVKASIKTSLRKVPAVKKTTRSTEEPSLVAASTFRSLVRHGETQLVAFVRDPQCVFTYWEITPEKLEEVKKELKEEFKTSFMVLRLYEVTENGDRVLVDEIRVEPEQINRYVELKQSGGVFVFEIARKTISGRVASYVRSKPIQTGLSFSSNGGGFSGAPGGGFASQPGMDPEVSGYFAEQGYEELLQSPGGSSSEENQRRNRPSHWSSSF